MDLRATEQRAQEQFAQGRFRESAGNFHLLHQQIPERLDLQAQLGYLALLANDLDAAVNQLAQSINRGLRSGASPGASGRGLLSPGPAGIRRLLLPTSRA